MYTKKLTVIVPEEHLDITRHLAAAIGESTAELTAFIIDHEVGIDKLSIASWSIKDITIDRAVETLIRPEFDTEDEIDMVKAAQAQALIRFDFDDVSNAITASTTHSRREMAAAAGITEIFMELPE